MRVKFIPVFFQWMFFGSIKEINSLRNETNMFLSKGLFLIQLKK